MEAATAAAEGAAGDGPGAAAEAGTEEPSGATTATDSTIIPKPANWGSMTKTQRKNWHKKAKEKWR